MKGVTFRDAAKEAGLKSHAGKKAIKPEYGKRLPDEKGIRFKGSVDLDEQFKEFEPNSNRWDYGVGLNDGKEFAVWIEMHPASSLEDVKLVLKKLKWLQSKLNSPGFERLFELTDAAEKKGVRAYHWIYKGRAKFRVGGQEEVLLAKVGMNLPGRGLRVRR